MQREQVASFSISHLRFLDEHGNTTQDLPEFAKDPDTLLYLYRTMSLTRAADAKAVNLQRTGRMGTYPSSLGQEAISVAIGHAMRKEDVFCPYYREQGTMLQRGVKIEDIFNYWGGDERGSNFGDGTSEDFPISVPIASQCLHATGVATAFKLRKQPRVAVVSCGDGATSEGDFYEAINLAGAWNLPVVFVVNNNKWAISVPLSEQTAAQTIAQKAIAAGFDGEQVDGNDVIAMHHTLEQAIENARQGGGPTLIEALTYRMCDHTTADDASRYRPREEVDEHRKKCPLVRLYNYLLNQGLWDKEKENALQAECAEKVQAAVDAYLNTENQPLTSMVDYLYETWPASLADQRDALLQEQQALEEKGEAVHG